MKKSAILNKSFESPKGVKKSRNADHALGNATFIKRSTEEEIRGVVKEARGIKNSQSSRSFLLAQAIYLKEINKGKAAEDKKFALDDKRKSYCCSGYKRITPRERGEVQGKKLLQFDTMDPGRSTQKAKKLLVVKKLHKDVPMLLLSRNGTGLDRSVHTVKHIDRGRIVQRGGQPDIRIKGIKKPVNNIKICLNTRLKDILDSVDNVVKSCKKPVVSIRSKQAVPLKPKAVDETTENGSTATNKSSAFIGKADEFKEIDDDCLTVIENDCDNDYGLICESVSKVYESFTTLGKKIKQGS